MEHLRIILRWFGRLSASQFLAQQVSFTHLQFDREYLYMYIVHTYMVGARKSPRLLRLQLLAGGELNNYI